jgi:hypothetical protein
MLDELDAPEEAEQPANGEAQTSDQEEEAAATKEFGQWRHELKKKRAAVDEQERAQRDQAQQAGAQHAQIIAQMESERDAATAASATARQRQTEIDRKLCELRGRIAHGEREASSWEADERSRQRDECEPHLQEQRKLRALVGPEAGTRPLRLEHRERTEGEE